MSILREKLLALDFAPSGVGAIDVEKQVAALNQKKESLQNHFTCEDLDRCETVNEFKQVAKNILFTNCDAAQDIVIKAHSFNGEGGKKLIWFFYQVRDGLMVVTPDKREQFLNRAFRRSGATFAIPE